MRLLLRTSIRYFLRHPAQIVLAILGVALGVAVVVAIDLANSSAQRAFELSTETITGKATDQIIGGPQGVPVDVYRDLRLQLNLPAIAPVIETTATLPEFPGRSFRLLGIDPFSEAPFRPYLAPNSADTQINRLLTEPATALLPFDTVTTLGITVGDQFALQLQGVTRTLTLVGNLQGQDELSRRALEDLIITDISTAGELLGRTDSIDRLDLILPLEQRAELQTAIEALLPPSVLLTTPAARSAVLEQLTRAFEVNLQALSLLALVVGIFLIYNTMTFSVVQRRRLFGTLRSLGVSRREVLALVLSEAALIGLIGAVLGVLLGIVLGRGLVRLVTQTINDLYFVVNVRQLSLQLWPLSKGFLLGMGATLLAALIPALEAMFAPPTTVLRRSSVEDLVRTLLPRTTGAGLLGLAGGLVLLLLPSRSLALSFSGLFIIILACALLTPAITVGMMRLAQPLFGRLFGVLGRQSARDVVAALSRTGIAIAALMVAVSVTVGAGTMIGSFRQTVVDWLDASLQADVYISPPSVSANRSTTLLEPAVIELVSTTPGVADTSSLINIEVASPYGPTLLSAVQLPNPTYQRQAATFIGDAEAAWQGFLQGGVWISEPYAYRTGLLIGDQLEVVADAGPVQLPIVGIYYDYSSEAGVVTLNRTTFDRFWDYDRITSLIVWAEPGVDLDQLIRDLEQRAGAVQTLNIQANRALRTSTLEIFDRTFAITNVLQVLATIVAFIGVLSALMALQLERARELGVLRAIGLTPRQLWAMVLSQTSLMGFTAGLLALPVGIILAYVLVFVINKRSFGWTLQMQLDPLLLLQALLLAMAAALLAGLYPAWKMSRSSPALALREE